MNKRRVFITVLLAFVLSFVCAFFAACSKKNDTGTNVEVTQVTLSKHSVDLQLDVTTTATLTVVVSPNNATDKTVTWTSGNTSVATVENGVVTAVAVGTTTITATAGGKSDTCTVNVYAAPAEHTHTAASEWQSDETYHWHNCTESTCIAQLDKAAHADANSDGKCDVCGYEMTVTPPEHTHTADSTWHTDETNHWHECTAGDGYEMDKAAHADANSDGMCDVCGYEMTVTPPEHTHTADSTWHTDETNHWHECTAGDGYEMDKAAHADANSDGMCDVCGYEMTVTPFDYTAVGEYVLDIANAGTTAGIYSWTNAGGGCFGTASDDTKMFKITSSSGSYDYLYINLKLKARQTITITGTMRTSNLTDSSKNSTVGISLKSGSTGAVTGLSPFSVSQSEGVKNINQTGTVTTEGTIVLQLSRTSGNTGCELLSFTVTISDPEPIAVTSVALDKDSASLKVGETDTLTATVSPENADNKNIVWSSDDETIATVSASGVVTALKAGTVTIKATSAADSNKYDSCVYTISNVAPTSITLNRTTATIAVTDTLNLTATVLPSNATIKTVTWSSSNTAVATVDANGKVTPVGTGNVTITATSTDANTVTATCTIEIKSTIVYATNISLNFSNENLKVDATLQLTATITPDNTDDKGVTWTTSNASVATVDANGFVTVVGAGTAVITATSNSNPSKYAECTINATYQTYTVTFISEGINKGEKVVRRGETTTAISITKQGYYLEGWYESSTFSGTAFDFSTAITKDITLYAKWVEAPFEITYAQGNLESAAIEWDEMNAASATVEYKLASADDLAYVKVDSELIRQVDSDTARVDVLGLKGGESYTFKVTSSAGGDITQTLAIKSYDRSGYAHFNYNSGVGAYNDDGTLKSNAIVLYVTDETKNTVKLTYDGITVTGIGNILNTAGMDVGTGLNAKGGTANTNQGILQKLADANIPLVVRFIGCVSDSGLYAKGTFAASSTPKINGLTIYNSIDMGGSTGDNGHMARMKSAKDVTLEGVGEDATIDGWGFHFMRSTSDRDSERGTSFEVRNLIFINTPEDAIGMEGTQGTLKADGTVENASSATADILGSVERCWVHNNEFYSPTISSPAESDKSEGDGSCDFKRGQYFTCSYNYFEGCHKTNLVGSSDSSLQFNLTYHHNYWKYCKARGPLSRRANIHMYNNVFEGQTDYAMNTRADAYIYSEYNLFYFCKNAQRVDGGAIKSYNDSFSSCIDGMGTIVTDKSQTVANNCKFSYRGIDYSKFDTTASQSYIPTGDYELQESVTEARKYIEAYCGVTKRNVKEIENITTSDISYLPSNVTPVAITVPSKVTPGKISKTVYAFTINAAATVTIAYSSEVLTATGVLINEAGECLLRGSGSVVLEPGTYIVQPMNIQAGDSTALGQFKECTINSIDFAVYDSEELNAKLIADYNTKAAAVQSATIAYNDASYQLIANAQNAYARLSDELKADVSVDYSVVTSALATYVALGVTEVETLISDIGTVNENSGTAISKARSAYQALISVAPSATVSNYSTLVAAEAAYESFKVQGLINQITALADPSTVSTEEAIESLLDEYQSAQNAYDALDTDQKAQVTNYSKVTDGITALSEKLTQVQAYAAITEKLDAVTDASTLTYAQCAEIIALYNKLSAEKQTEMDSNTKYTAVKAQYDVYATQTKVAVFGSPANAELTPASAGFTISGTVGYKSSASFSYDGTDYTAMKFQSGNTITFTASSRCTLTIYLHTGGSQVLVIGGTSYTAVSNGTFGVITVTLDAGNYTIGRSSESWLCYATVSPATN